jgi:gamma-glutamyltranspeptidase/glutathione hydrolase
MKTLPRALKYVSVLSLFLAATQITSPVEAQEVAADRTNVAPAVERMVEPPSRPLKPNAAQSRRNMVATVSPQATQAGLAAMQQGGNAIDAAIAAALTLGVVDGYNSGIGGGCFILIRTADGKLHAIDGRETAPAAADRDFYRDESGTIQPQQSRTGAKAVAVPGALMALEQAGLRHGRLKFSELILPAAQIAEDGFEISSLYSSRISKVQATIAQFPETAGLLLDENQKPIPAGSLLKQPDLARTYRSIAKNGSSWFYNGEFAKRVSQWMSENGGAITESDFANYSIVDREPIVTTYRCYTVVGFPPPSSGGIHVAQILNTLEHFDLAAISGNCRGEAIHLVVEAMKLAFADRSYWPGDPAFVGVPKGLISKRYGYELATRIDPGWATKVLANGQPPNPEDVFQDRHTTHISTADSEGNWVAITSTINTTFGSKVIVPGTGVILNNEMDDFSIAPGVPNAFDLIGADNNKIVAGKRPLSSMSPTIVLCEGQPVMALGAAGGPKIITQVACTLINTIDFQMTPEDAIGAPRIHHQWSPDRIQVENTVDSQLQAEVEAFGHKMVLAESDDVGVSQIIAWDPKTGIFTGAHDPRVPGQAMGADPLLPAPVIESPSEQVVESTETSGEMQASALEE